MVFYLWMIFSAIPKFMKDKKPYKMANWMRFYNIFQITVCAYAVKKTYNFGFDFNSFWKCEHFEFSDESTLDRIKSGSWWFLILRVSEGLETFAMGLRKKESQATFLHIYHHISTVMFIWIFLFTDTSKMKAHE